MSRPHLLIASRRPAVAASLHEFINLFLPSAELTHSVKHIGFKCSAELFDALDELPPKQLLNTMVVFDIGAEDESAWNVMQMRGDRALAAQLLLSYPEVYFVFLGAPGSSNNFKQGEKTFVKCSGPEAPEDNTAWSILQSHHFVNSDNLTRVVELIQLHARGFRTLFDATGLRSCLKFQLLEQLQQSLDDVSAGVYRHFSAKRLELTAFIAEEEASFLYLNGYAAYKFGFRAWLAHSKKEFLRLLSDDPARLSGVAAPRKFATAVMDWHLAYRDDDDLTGKELDRVREKAFEENRIAHSIVVTSFPHLSSQWRKRSEVLPKPYGGFFDLLQKSSKGTGVNLPQAVYASTWEKMIEEVDSSLICVDDLIDSANLTSKLRDEQDPLSTYLRGKFTPATRQLLDQYAAPGQPEQKLLNALVDEINQLLKGALLYEPTAFSQIQVSEETKKLLAQKPQGKKLVRLNRRLLEDAYPHNNQNRHSAPYACSVVVERLLSRAHRLKADDPAETEAWIQMALLADEAKEILGGLSLTTTYQALALQHEAEVRAESSFLGMSKEIEVGGRLDELHKEVELVQNAGRNKGQIEQGETSEIGRVNCLLLIVHNLRMRFTENEQVEAAEHCLRKFTQYQQRLKRLHTSSQSHNKLSKALGYVLDSIAMYPEKVTKAGTSIGHLFGWSLVWIFIFFLCYSALFYFHPEMKNNLGKSAMFGFGHSLFTFAELQPGLSEAEDMRKIRANEQSSAIDANQLPAASGGDVGAEKQVALSESPPQSQITVLLPMPWLILYWLLLFMELVIAYVHLGLLVSVLYRRITKRAP